MSNVSIKGLNKSYGKLQVLFDINLELPDNSFVVFVGPSGCGKSTLLRTIAGLEDKDSGAIYLNDRDISDDAPVDRNIAMVFQSYALYPQMTVRENIGFALSIAKLPKDEIAKKVNQTAKLLKLDELLDRKPKDLSGGQRQRVAIGRAVLRDPSVFLFDEPLSNLDAELRVEMRLQIAELRRKLSSTFIYVTHDQVEAMTLADQIVVLRAGKIEQVGTPMELYHSPANMFVAGFIGSPKMNFFKGVKSGENRIAIETGGDISTPKLPISEGSIVNIGVRPENVVIDTNGSIETTIVAVENLGPVSYAHCKLSNEQLVTVQLSPDHTYSLDQKVNLALLPDNQFYFGVDEQLIKLDAGNLAI